VRSKKEKKYEVGRTKYDWELRSKRRKFRSKWNSWRPKTEVVESMNMNVPPAGKGR